MKYDFIGFLEYEEPSIHASVHITDICNFKCDYCQNKNFINSKDSIYHKITLNTAQKLINKINFWTLSGGEPLASPILFNILDLLNKDKYPSIKEISILTNLSLIDTKIEQLKKYDFHITSTFHSNQISSEKYIEKLKILIQNYDNNKINIKLFNNLNNQSENEKVLKFLEKYNEVEKSITSVVDKKYKTNISAGLKLNEDKKIIKIKNNKIENISIQEFNDFNYLGYICNGIKLFIYGDKIIENCSHQELSIEEVLKMNPYQICKLTSCKKASCFVEFSKSKKVINKKKSKNLI